MSHIVCEKITPCRTFFLQGWRLGGYEKEDRVLGYHVIMIEEQAPPLRPRFNFHDLYVLQFHVGKPLRPPDYKFGKHKEQKYDLAKEVMKMLPPPSSAFLKASQGE